MNIEQGILNDEIKTNSTSSFKIPCSIFKIQSYLNPRNLRFHKSCKDQMPQEHPYHRRKNIEVIKCPPEDGDALQVFIYDYQ